MTHEEIAHGALLEAYKEVIRKWRDAAPADIAFHGTVMIKDFYHLAGQLDEGYDSELYEMLRAAYPNETMLTVAIDKAGDWFDRRVKDMAGKGMWWSEYEEIRVRVRAIHRSMGNFNDHTRKLQVLTVLVAYELSRTTRNARVDGPRWAANGMRA